MELNEKIARWTEATITCGECRGSGRTHDYQYHGSVDREWGDCHRCRGTGQTPIWHYSNINFTESQDAHDKYVAPNLDGWSVSTFSGGCEAEVYKAGIGHFRAIAETPAMARSLAIEKLIKEQQDE